MINLNEYLLPEHERPAWLKYPLELVELVTSGLMALTPWQICEIDMVVGSVRRLQERLNRQLVPFAYRQDREDLACFEKGHGEMVFIIHDNTDPGWENEGCYASFPEWLRAVRLESEHWQ